LSRTGNGEDEQTLTAIKLADLAGWVLLMMGLLLCATWALGVPPGG
jgi:hypothetical protein